VAERLEQPCQRHGMLAGQQVRGRKKRPLSARVRHEGQRQGGHGGLPRPYVSLEQPHHRPPPPQIDCDRGHCRDLVRGKARGLRVADASSDLFGQGNLDRADRLADSGRRHVNRFADRLLPPSLARHHSDFQRQQFVVAEPAQGRVAGRERLGVMGVLKGGGNGHRGRRRLGGGRGATTGYLPRDPD
jgi:ribosomal protein L44E